MEEALAVWPDGKQCLIMNGSKQFYCNETKKTKPMCLGCPLRNTGPFMIGRKGQFDSPYPFQISPRYTE